MGCLLQLFAYGTADSGSALAGIYVNRKLTVTPDSGVTIATISLTDSSCVIVNSYDSFDTSDSSVRTELQNLLIGFPSGTIVVGITKETTLSSTQEFSSFETVDEIYGTKFMSLRYKYSMLFIAKKDYPSFATTYLAKSGDGPLQSTNELKQFTTGTTLVKVIGLTLANIIHCTVYTINC